MKRIPVQEYDQAAAGIVTRFIDLGPQTVTIEIEEYDPAASGVVKRKAEVAGVTQ